MEMKSQFAIREIFARAERNSGFDISSHKTYLIKRARINGILSLFVSARVACRCYHQAAFRSNIPIIR